MEKLLNPKSIAIVGASNKKDKIGNILLQNLKSGGYKGKIYPINPKHYKIEGIKAYPSVLDVKDKIDLVVIALPAKLVVQAVEDCAWRNTPIQNIIIISAGFSEAGKKGAEKEKELKQLAKEYNLNILGPNCLGIINNQSKLNASFAKREVPEGNVAIVSQSGAFVTALLDMAIEEKLGFSKVVTLGNKAVLNESHFLDYLADDSSTRAVGFYLESISFGKEFRNKLIELSRKKPVLVLKAGNSKKVKKAIQSHTGSMAGEVDVARAALEEAGGLFFDDIASFWNALRLFNHLNQNKKEIKGNQGVILTNAGGPGVIATDLIEKSRELKIYDFPKELKDSISKVLPNESSVENPIDVLGDADPERYDNALKALHKNREIGFVVALITPQSQTDIKGILSKIKKRSKKSFFPIFPVVMSSVSSQQEANESPFRFPSDLTKALENSILYLRLIKDQAKKKKQFVQSISKRSEKAYQIYEGVVGDSRKVFYYKEAVELAELYGINSLGAEEFASKSGLDHFNMQSTSILKIDNPSVLHKTNKGGVVAGIEDKKDLRKAGRYLWKNFPGTKLILQEQIESGVEFILGIKKDSSFGPVLMCGVGGVLTEVFDEKIIWILPVDKNEIKRKIKNSKIFKILEKQGLEITSLSDLAYNVAEMGWENSWIKELDINPAFLYQDKPSITVDVKVKID
ncbi:MAG: acetate--CoA ligase family protein [Candidatus Moraniibacteriota bacterium]